MKTKAWIAAVTIALATGAAWRLWGGAAVATVTGALLIWLLLHYTRLMKVMQRAAQRPMGTVDSAVMLNAKLSKGMGLLHIIGLTRSLGQPAAEPTRASGSVVETFVWTDASNASVTVELRQGKAQRWELTRPESDT